MTYIVKDIKAEAAKLAELGVFQTVAGICKFSEGRFFYSAGFSSEEDFKDFITRNSQSLPKWIRSAKSLSDLTQSARKIIGLVNDLNQQNMLDQMIKEVGLVRKVKI